jgi:hypothetical protein
VSSLKDTLHAFKGEHWYLSEAAAAGAQAWDDIARQAPTMREAMLLDEARKRTSYARDFGTAVHHYAEQLWTGQPVEVPQEYVGHVRAIAEWWEAQGVGLVVAERMCWADDDELGAGPYAGRFDLILNHPSWGQGLVDLKTWTTRSAGTPRPEEWAFQLAAYSAMEWLVMDDEDVPMPEIDWAGVLHVGPSGALLYTLPDSERRKAADQVMEARSLKALPKPKMVGVA